MDGIVDHQSIAQTRQSLKSKRSGGPIMEIVVSQTLGQRTNLNVSLNFYKKTIFRICLL